MLTMELMLLMNKYHYSRNRRSMKSRKMMKVPVFLGGGGIAKSRSR